MTKQKFIPKSVPKIRNFQDAPVALVLIQDKKYFRLPLFAPKPSYWHKIKTFQRKSRENYFFYCAWLTLKLPRAVKHGFWYFATMTEPQL